MVEAIKTTVVDIPWAEFFGKQIILIHPNAKYVVVCGEIDKDKANELAIFLMEWYEDLTSTFAILVGDYMLVRVDKLPPNVKDRLGISDEE